jgi:hypothetical protein
MTMTQAGPLSRILLAAAARCGFHWATESQAVIAWHTCTGPPGHAGSHACPCGAAATRAA